MIVARIKNGERPSKHHVAAALRRGEAVPLEAQVYAADLLEGRIDRRGRPKSGDKKWPDIKLSLLQMQMDELVFSYKAEMKSAPRRGARDNRVVQRAQQDLAKKYKLEPDTLQRYLRQAAKLMELPDVGLALEVNEERERLGKEGAADPLHGALERIASKRKLPLASIRGCYERGKRWVRKHVEDSPEFN